MKHRKLLIVILVCIIVFIASSVAGIIVAANTVEWNKLTISGLMNGDFGGLFEGKGLAGLFRGNKINRTIDKFFSLPLENIETIRITGVAEQLEIGLSDGDQVECRLSGEYYTAYRDMEYVYETNGSQLHIHPDYPVFGFINVDLVQQVLIPANFAGRVEIGTVSGDCAIGSLSGATWSSLAFTGVSGSFKCDLAAVEQIRFENISGRVILQGCTGHVQGKTVSGPVTIDWQSFNGGKLNTVSGDISLQLPADASCKLIFDSVSGGVNNQDLGFEMSNSSGGQSTYVLNGGEYLLDVETVSGDLKTSPTP